MRYNRDESFRYDFRPALEGSFIIEKVNQHDFSSSTGKLFIENMSPKGIAMSTEYNLPDPTDFVVTLQIICSIEDKTLTFSGDLQWKKTEEKEYRYGLRLTNDEKSQQEIVSLLKKYVRSHLVE